MSDALTVTPLSKEHIRMAAPAQVHALKKQLTASKVAKWNRRNSPSNFQTGNSLTLETATVAVETAGG